MPYFRADAHLMAQMVNKDCLRYNKENLASLLAIFALPAKGGKIFHVSVMLFGESAEDVNRVTEKNLWYEIKGLLTDQTISFEEYILPKISIKANSIIQIPAILPSLLRCELIGRLTRDPEQINKADSYDFVRFSVAVNRKNMTHASYFDVSVFKTNLIEQVNQHAHKGQTVYAAGDISFFQKGSEQTVYASVKLDQFLSMDKL